MADLLISSDSEEDLMSGDEEYLEASSSMSVPAPARAIQLQLITEASSLPAQREVLGKVIEFLAVKEQHARTLLIHHRWDFERLVDAFVEKGKECLFSEAGLAITRPESTNSVVTVCTICGEEGLKEEDTTTMDCGHTFCSVCWTRHALVKISEGQSCKRIECMAADCNVICDEDIIRKLVAAEDPEAAQRFDRFLFQSFIDDNEKVKWCPSVPHCGNAVRVEGLDHVHCEIQCTCGHQFCFNCLAQPHSPCSCSIWKLWDKKCRDESESQSQNWIAVNTKSCPRCGKNAAKDGGCNSMRCVCGQHFCWLCGAATGVGNTRSRTIVRHTCARYKEDQEEEKDIEKATRDFDHYYSKYNHSLKQREFLEQKISNFESKESGSFTDYSWLKNALQRLFIARRIIAYSYAFAFHMFGGDEILSDILTPTEKELKQGLFEDQQQQLEATVERLSQLIHYQSLMDNKTDIINLSDLVDRRCGQFYDWIQNDLLLRTHGRIAPYNSEGVHILSDST